MRSAKMRKCEIEPRIKCEFDSAKLWCENMYKMRKCEKWLTLILRKHIETYWSRQRSRCTDPRFLQSIWHYHTAVSWASLSITVSAITCWDGVNHSWLADSSQFWWMGSNPLKNPFCPEFHREPFWGRWCFCYTSTTCRLVWIKTLAVACLLTTVCCTES